MLVINNQQLINNRQRGLSLIESMIALVVISIGLLGIAGLQITSMQQNTSAGNHNQAVWVGYNIADRIRANFDQVDGYAGIDTSNDYTQDCSTSPCSPAQMVTSDASEWKRLVESLPSGRGRIAFNATNSSQLDISVMWDDEGTGATGTDCGSNPAVDLTCYTVTLVR